MLKKQYTEAVVFFKGKILKTFCRCMIAFWIIFVITALAVKIVGLDQLVSLVDYLLNRMSDSGDSTDTVNTWYGLLIHNGTSDFLTMFLGFVPFLFLPAILLAYNGALFGAFTALHSLITSQPLLLSFLCGAAPHGILEYSVNCLTFAMGIYFCKIVTKRICKKDSDDFKPAILNCLRVFVFFVLPGLLIAGIIEANVTPYLLHVLVS